MTRIELASITLMVAALIATAWLFLVLPYWPVPATPFAILGISLVLLGFQLPAGFSLGQLGLFFVFLIGVANSIGDWEVPVYVEPMISPMVQVIVVCLLFLGSVIVLRRAQAQMRARLRGV
jgi:hypothetical protein